MDAEEGVRVDRGTRIDVEVEALRKFIEDGGSQAVDVFSQRKKLSESIRKLCAVFAELAVGISATEGASHGGDELF